MNLGKKLLNLLQQVTHRSVLSWPVFLLTVLASILIHLFTSGDLEFSNLGLRSLFAALSVIPMFLVIWLAFLIPTRSAKIRTYLVFGSFLLGGALRGLSLTLLLDAFGIAEFDQSLFRVLAGAVSMSNSVAIITYFWSSLNMFLRSIEEQNREHADIRASLQLVQNESKEAAAKQAAAITEEILSTLSSLSVRSSSERVAEIGALIEDRVRPLSKALLENSQQWEPVRHSRPRTPFFEVLSNLNFAKNVPSSWLTILLAFTPFPVLFPEFGTERALLVALAAIAVMFPMGIGAKRFVIPRIAKLGSWQQVPVLTFFYGVIGLMGGLATVLPLIGTSRPTALVIPGMAAFMVFSWLLTIGLASIAALRELKKSLEALGKTLRWATSRANLVSINNRRVLARFLHGPVQASLHAVIFRLKEGNEEDSTELIFEEIRTRLSDARQHELTLPELRSQLSDFEAVWEGVAEVRIRLGEAAALMLSEDSQLASHMLELSGQLISSAIRKRQATKIQLEISVTDDGQLQLLISDDGILGLDQATPDQADLLAECAIEIGTRQNGDLSERYLVLPSAKAL